MPWSILGALFGLNAWLGRGGRRGRRGRWCGGDRLFLRSHERHHVPHAHPRVLATRLLGRAEMARRDRRLRRHSAIPDKPSFLGWDLSNSLAMYFMALRLLSCSAIGGCGGSSTRRSAMSSSAFARTSRACWRSAMRTRAYKLLSFTIAGAVAGLAGGLYAIFNGFISPDAIYWTASGDILIMVMLGGAGTLIGPVIGAGDLPADEESGQLLQRALDADHRRGLHQPACCSFPAASGDTLRQLRLRRRDDMSVLRIDHSEPLVRQPDRHQRRQPDRSRTASATSSSARTAPARPASSTRSADSLRPSAGRILSRNIDITGWPPRPDLPHGRGAHLPAQQPVSESERASRICGLRCRRGAAIRSISSRRCRDYAT